MDNITKPAAYRFQISFLILSGIIFSLSILLPSLTQYPPSVEQISLYQSPILSTLSSIILFILSIVTLFIFSKRLKLENKYMFIGYLLLSPIFITMLLRQPIEYLKLLIVVIIISLIVRFGRVAKICGIIFIGLFIWLTSMFVTHQSPALTRLINSKVISETVINKFDREDILVQGVYIPRIIKRLSYNKYFMLLKTTTEETLNFADYETIFFQEVHPLSQKAIPLLFWPESIIFIVSLYIVLNKKQSSNHLGNFTLLLITGIVYFEFSTGNISNRLALIGFSIVYLISITASSYLYGKYKFITVVLLILTIMGAIAHITDRSLRPDYWFDNIPLYYKQALTNPILDKNKSPIYISDHFNLAIKYCQYYRTDCDRLVIMDSFTDSNRPVEGIYIGYLGDYLSPQKDNFVSSTEEISQYFSQKNIEEYTTYDIRDNILNEYGKQVVISMWIDPNEK